MRKIFKHLQSLVAILAIGLFLFEQSPINEAIRAVVGFKVLHATSNALLVGLAVGMITLLVELSSSILIAVSLNNSRRFKKFSKRFARKSTKAEDKNSASDYILALGVGAGTLVIKKHFKTKKQTLRADLKSALKATLAITLFSTFVGFLAGGGVELMRSIGLHAQAQYFLDIVTNWKFWLVVVIGSQLIEFINYRRRGSA